MKVYKEKRRSCGLCKPHKRGMQPCWTPKEFATVKRMEEEIQENMHSESVWDGRLIVNQE